MRILIVNTFHYIRGGDCRHAFGLADLLKNEGHEVHFFAMKCDNNFPCEDEKYFINEIDYRKVLKEKKILNASKVIWHSIYSFEAKKNIARLLNSVKPDIAHFHSIRHHITKSILPEFGKRNIPVVWTLHDYKEVCPNTSFYDGRHICEKCKDKRYSHVIWNRCKKGSLPASVVTYLESKINNRNYFDKYIDLYISPSKFLKDKFIAYGYDPKKIISVPNFVELEKFELCHEYKNYLLYLGRLEKEKGLITLLKGFARVTESFPSISLKIAGSGDLEKEIREFIDSMKLSNVELVGFKQGEELEEITRNAKAVVIPSEWYENYPFSCLEAMAYGKPVIASDIGGIPEQVEDGATGFLFEPFNDKMLSSKIDMLNKMKKEEIVEMGKKARQKVETVNSRQAYLESIIPVYNSLLESKHAIKT